MQIGEVEELVITSSGGHLMVGCINNDYSLVMTAKRNCPVAQALCHFRRAISELKREI